MFLRTVSYGCLLMASACASPSDAPDGDASPAIPTTPRVDDLASPAAPTPVANYDEREGDTYFYTTAVSEDDKKKGKALGSVLPFRFRGEKQGVFHLDSPDDDGRPLLRYECANPCRIIKEWAGDKVRRVPYDPSSVIGAAYQDALSGRLEPSRNISQAVATAVKNANASRETPSAGSLIPLVFRGEWNQDLRACGTGLNDSRLRIEARRLRFYESDGEVRTIKILSDRSVVIDAAFSGEGQAWIDKTQLVLSRSGAELMADGSTLSRCPDSPSN